MASLTIAKVRDIPVRLHLTFLLVLPIFAYLMARFYFMPEGGVPSTAAWVWGSLLTIGLFTSVLLHEFGHSFTALNEGVGVRSITLLPIGGVSAFEHMPREAGKEFKITIMGPLVNFVIGLPLLAIVLLVDLDALLPGLELFLYWLAVLNLVLGVFNLFVPAFPMDGGRILRSLLVPKMGRVKATHVASLVGRGLAVLMGIWGFLTFLAGGWLLVLIAFFIYSGAQEEERATRVTEALADYRVADVMTRQVDTLSHQATAEEALNRMLATKHVALPVVDEGTVLGVVHLDLLQQVPEDQRWHLPVGEMISQQDPPVVLSPRDEAIEAARLLSQEKGEAVVLDEDGHLQGIVTRTDIVRFAQLVQAGATLPRRRGGGGGAAGPGFSG